MVTKTCHEHPYNLTTDSGGKAGAEEMDSPGPLTSKASLILDLPPSCVQFCPVHPEYFVVGTYSLQKDETTQTDSPDQDEPEARKRQNRNGSLVLFKTDGESLTLVQTVLLPSAILDLRFHLAQEKQDTLAVVSSTGTLAVFKLDPIASTEAPLVHVTTSRCGDLDEDILLLQCNWHPLDTHTLGLTTSTGLARLVHLDNDWRIRDWSDLDIQNSLEAWCIAFSPVRDGETEDQCTIYCGGDDSLLRYNTYQTITGSENTRTFETAFTSMAIKGHHDAGVTAILPLSLEDSTGGRLVVTGSYDDHVRLLAIHDLDKTYGMKRARLLAEENLGGGVWRLDLVSSSKETNGDVRALILASCMHAGARVIELRHGGEGDEWAWKVLARFEEHQSMNYGCSFMERPRDGGKVLSCVSTSFYDKLLCLWDYQP